VSFLELLHWVVDLSQLGLLLAIWWRLRVRRKQTTIAGMLSAESDDELNPDYYGIAYLRGDY